MVILVSADATTLFGQEEEWSRETELPVISFLEDNIPGRFTD